MNLLDACRIAIDTFERYAAMHDAKGTPEGVEKARANRELSKMLSAAAESDPHAFGALGLVADLRAALGDPDGRMMQAELIAHARSVKAAQVRGDVALDVLRQIVTMLDAFEDHHASPAK